MVMRTLRAEWRLLAPNQGAKRTALKAEIATLLAAEGRSVAEGWATGRWGKGIDPAVFQGCVSAALDRFLPVQGGRFRKLTAKLFLEQLDFLCKDEILGRLLARDAEEVQLFLFEAAELYRAAEWFSGRHRLDSARCRDACDGAVQVLVKKARIQQLVMPLAFFRRIAWIRCVNVRRRLAKELGVREFLLPCSLSPDEFMKRVEREKEEDLLVTIAKGYREDLFHEEKGVTDRERQRFHRLRQRIQVELEARLPEVTKTYKQERRRLKIKRKAALGLAKVL
jgi:hypothetical protein